VPLFSRVLLVTLVAVLAVALFGVFAGDVSPPRSRPSYTAPRERDEDENSRVMVLVSTVSIVQTALIVALVVQRRRQQKIEESLKDSEERIALATLPENLGLWQWNAQTDEIWATAHVRDILQIPRAASLTRASMLVSLHPEDRAHFEEAFVRSVNGEVLDSDFRVMTCNGELRWVTGKARARRDVSGRIVRVTGVVMDITDRKRAEAENQTQRLQLTHLTRVAILGQISGALAHELAQPLTAILSNAQAAQRFLASSELDMGEMCAILEDIVNDDKRAGEVILRVRALLRRGEIQRQPLDVAPLIWDALSIAHSDLIARQVDVSCRLDPRLPAVLGDKVQIQQVLLNLLLNAAEAMLENDVRDRRIDISAVPEGNGVRISVSDCGVGIAPDRLESVFEAFHTTKSNGLGLGLAICRSIVTAHNGRMWATNNAQRGSAFHFTLPVPAGPPAEETIAQSLGSSLSGPSAGGVGAGTPLRAGRPSARR
jgi:C4-dicarboxylate-specific signal transduction histidine kinase